MDHIRTLLLSALLEPITPPDYGHGMLFRTFDGKLLISLPSDNETNGRTIRIPHLFEVNDAGDKIIDKNKSY